MDVEIGCHQQAAQSGSAIDKLADTVSYLIKVIEETGGVAGRTADRVLGARPEATSPASQGNDAPANGAISALSSQIDRAITAAQRTLDQVFRLEKL
ncbi:hypothetical protein [Paracoccus sp. AS002]|uniref:hypothetical protein n=1 Tax=Paracoccus sp. AS002 TaxID=3019545 RepID=UPI0023E7B5B5|nr:hypothetical protein [Paracoccus sp. AS002]MDF3904666.1 hypothetical protein [Paracoccus sp. AS002]